MGQRGPREPGNITVLKPVEKKRPDPLKGMSKQACSVWRRIVNDYKPEHFKPHHYGLLMAYCEAEAMHNRTIKEIANIGDVIKQENGVVKENPYINIQIKALNAMSQLGTKLGITVNATTATRKPNEEEKKPHTSSDGLLYKRT